jgi:hypothetical protein
MKRSNKYPLPKPTLHLTDGYGLLCLLPKLIHNHHLSWEDFTGKANVPICPECYDEWEHRFFDQLAEEWDTRNCSYNPTFLEIQADEKNTPQNRQAIEPDR